MGVMPVALSAAAGDAAAVWIGWFARDWCVPGLWPAVLVTGELIRCIGLGTVLMTAAGPAEAFTAGSFGRHACGLRV